LRIVVGCLSVVTFDWWSGRPRHGRPHHGGRRTDLFPTGHHPHHPGIHEEIQQGQGDRLQHLPVLPEERLRRGHDRPGAGEEAELLLRRQAGARGLPRPGLWRAALEPAPLTTLGLQERARAAALGYPDPTNPNFEATSDQYHKTLTECPEADQGVQGPGRGEEDRHNGGVAQRGHRPLCHPEDERVRHRARGQGHLLRTAVGHVRLHHFPAR
jgi:hypothetical protein